MNHGHLPPHLNLRSPDPMGPYQANQERPPRQYDTVFRGDQADEDQRYQVYYDGEWWYLPEYLIIDPLTRTQDDVEVMLKALQHAAAELADERGREEIGPVFSGQTDVLTELLRRARLS